MKYDLSSLPKIIVIDTNTLKLQYDYAMNKKYIQTLPFLEKAIDELNSILDKKTYKIDKYFKDNFWLWPVEHYEMNITIVADVGPYSNVFHEMLETYLKQYYKRSQVYTHPTEEENKLWVTFKLSC